MEGRSGPTAPPGPDLTPNAPRAWQGLKGSYWDQLEKANGSGEMRGWGLGEGNGRTTSHRSPEGPGDTGDSLECPSLAGVAQGTGATAGSSGPSQKWSWARLNLGRGHPKLGLVTPKAPQSWDAPEGGGGG